MAINPEWHAGAQRARWIVAVEQSDRRLHILQAHATKREAEAHLRDIQRWENWKDARIFDARVCEVVYFAPRPVTVAKCSGCGKPAHASETDDLDRCADCAKAAGEPHVSPEYQGATASGLPDLHGPGF